MTGVRFFSVLKFVSWFYPSELHLYWSRRLSTTGSFPVFHQHTAVSVVLPVHLCLQVVLWVCVKTKERRGSCRVRGHCWARAALSSEHWCISAACSGCKLLARGQKGRLAVGSMHPRRAWGAGLKWPSLTPPTSACLFLLLRSAPVVGRSLSVLFVQTQKWHLLQVKSLQKRISSFSFQPKKPSVEITVFKTSPILSMIGVRFLYVLKRY